MNKVGMILMVCLITTTISYAQKNNINPPKPVKETFKSKFPDVKNPKWEKEDKKNFEANFKQQGKEMSACFKPDGQWIETETEIMQSELPEAVAMAIKNDYKGYKVKETERVESAEFGSCFEVEMKKGATKTEVRFSPEGKKLK